MFFFKRNQIIFNSGIITNILKKENVITCSKLGPIRFFFFFLPFWSNDQIYMIQDGIN